METNMALSGSVKTLYEIDGREFVDVEDFLSCYPAASEKAKQEIRNWLGTFNGDVEKRVEDSLFGKLIETCWKADSRIGALYAPVVLRDGWVVWVSQGHESLIDALGRLFVPREEPQRSMDEILARLSGEVTDSLPGPNTDLLTHGHAWYISTTRPKILWVGRSYRPSRADREIFDVFDVRYFD